LKYPEPVVDVKVSNPVIDVKYAGYKIDRPKFEAIANIPELDVIIDYGRMLSSDGKFRDIIRREFPRESYTHDEMLSLQVAYLRSFKEQSTVLEALSFAIDYYKGFLESVSYHEEFMVGLHKYTHEVTNPVLEDLYLQLEVYRQLKDTANPAIEDIRFIVDTYFSKEMMQPVVELLVFTNSFYRLYLEVARRPREALFISANYGLTTADLFDVTNSVVEVFKIGQALSRLVHEITHPHIEAGMFRKTSYSDPSYFEEDYVEDQRVLF